MTLLAWEACSRSSCLTNPVRVNTLIMLHFDASLYSHAQLLMAQLLMDARDPTQSAARTRLLIVKQALVDVSWYSKAAIKLHICRGLIPAGLLHFKQGFLSCHLIFCTPCLIQIIVCIIPFAREVLNVVI